MHQPFHIFNIGISHNSSGVDYREAVYLNEEACSKFLKSLLDNNAQISEAAVLSTCNRFELFGVWAGELPQQETFMTLLAEAHPGDICSLDTLRGNCFVYSNESAIHHLFSVCASLDSVVVGETQITGQFKKAISLAKESSTIGTVLDRLAQDALACSKKIRRNTPIGEKTVSISHAAIDLAGRVFGELPSRKILIIGAGEMARLALEYAYSYKPKELKIANRTIAKAEELTARYEGVSSHTLDELPKLISEADIVISCTGAEKPIISREMLEIAIKKREQTSLFLCDIAIPRDIDPACSEFDEVYLFEVDDLKKIVDENLKERRQAAESAEEFISHSLKSYLKWLSSFETKPLLADINEKLENLLEKEFSKTTGKGIFRNLETKQRESLSRLQESIRTKILGQIALAINSTPEDETPGLVKALEKIFDTPQK